MTDGVKEPCGNEDCDLCYPLPRWVVSAERVARIRHKREIKAATPEAARLVYDQGTAWPSSYDDKELEVLEENEPVVALAEARTDRTNSALCWHNLPETPLFTELTSCDFVGDSGCTDPDCEKCHKRGQ